MIATLPDRETSSVYVSASSSELPIRQPATPCPDFGIIHMLHRGQEQIPIAHKDAEGKFHDLFTLPAWDAPRIFPEIAPYLMRDSFFTINGFWLPNGRLKSDYSFTTCRGNRGKLLRPYRQRRAEYLQRINAIHVDIDCSDAGINPARAICELMEMQNAGHLPKISVYQKSGRGVWAFWLIRDRQFSDRGQQATRQAVCMAKLLNKTVQKRLSHLGSDPQAMDLTRITRVPGSLNTKSDTNVEYFTRSDACGNIAAYTLDEIMTFFNLSISQKAPSDGKGLVAVPKGLNPRQGAKARWQKEVERFRTLWKHRGVFREGVRAAAVYLHYTFLRQHKKYSDISDQQVKDEMDSLFKCLEKVDGTKVTDASVKGKSRIYSRSDFDRQLKTESDAIPSHEMISQQLKITEVESRLTGWPEFGSVPELSRDNKQAMRRQLLRSWYVDGGEPAPSCRMIAERISRTDIRLKCAHRTISDDINVVMGPVTEPLCNFKANRGESQQSGSGDTAGLQSATIQPARQTERNLGICSMS